MKKAGLLILGLLVLSGCSSLEKKAYNVIVSSNAFLKSIKANHPECSQGAVSATCTYLAQAIAAKDTLIDAVEVYCSGPNFNAGGACDVPNKNSPGYQQATEKLTAALGAYEQIETDLKGVLRK